MLDLGVIATLMGVYPGVFVAFCVFILCKVLFVDTLVGTEAL